MLFPPPSHNMTASTSNHHVNKGSSVLKPTNMTNISKLHQNSAAEGESALLGANFLTNASILPPTTSIDIDRKKYIQKMNNTANSSVFRSATQDTAANNPHNDNYRLYTLQASESSRSP